MRSTVLDASAVLAYLQEEPGSDIVRTALLQGAACGTANWSEVAQKTIRSGRNWSDTSTLLSAFDVLVEPVTLLDAECAAGLWLNRSNLSLADRLCIALGDRFDAEVLTADGEWGAAGRIRQIR